MELQKNKFPLFTVISLVFHLGIAVVVGLAVQEKTQPKIIEVSFGEGRGGRSGNRSGSITYKRYVAKVVAPKNSAIVTKKAISNTTVVENKISMPASSTVSNVMPSSGTIGNGTGNGSGSGSGSGDGNPVGSGSNDPMAKYVGVIHKLVSNKKRYPAIAQKLRQQGVVVLKVKLNKSGHLLNVEVVEASKYKTLTDASVDAVKNIDQFPAIPSEIKMDEISFNIPFDYKTEIF